MILILVSVFSLNAHAGLLTMMLSHAVTAGEESSKKCGDPDYAEKHKLCQYEAVAKDKWKEHQQKKLEQQQNKQ